MKKKCSALLLAGFLAFGAGQISMADYMVGSRGPEVQNIQRRLISNGYRLKADGNYNSQTSAAVKKFQFKKHLDVDGIVGPATYKALMGKAMSWAPEKSTRKAGHEANHKTFMGIDDATVQWHHENAMSSTVKAIMEEAKKYVGVPYQFGGTTHRGFD